LMNTSNQKVILTIVALVAWFAVIAQLVLMINNRVASMPETVLRFFSFFTILTNLLVAIYFLTRLVKKPIQLHTFFSKPGVLTAITVYITVVGLVYQLVLRQIWEPTGLQKVVDELLHSVIPLLVIVCWFLYENKKEIRWSVLPGWLLYPLIYLVYILIRGHFSGFYPYPFVHVGDLGYPAVLMNAVGLLFVFSGLSALLIFIGRKLSSKN